MYLLVQYHVYFYTILSMISSLTVTKGNFATSPSDQTIKEGTTAYLFCIYPAFDSLEVGSQLAWLRSGSRITNSMDAVIPDRVDDASRYSIEFDSPTSRFGLTLLNIKRTDATDYACAVYNGDNRLVEQADSATLTVSEIPKKPICLNFNDNYEEGLTATITCRVENTNPPAVVQWRKGNDILRNTVREDASEVGWVDYSYSFEPTHEDNRATFTCQVTTEAEPSFAKNCTTGAMNVLYRPRVIIQGSTTINEGQEAVLFCESDANPDAVSFQWTFDPPIPNNKIRLENGNKILRILNPTREMNNSNVVCMATNRLYTGSANNPLVISSQTIVTYTTGSASGPGLIDTQVNPEPDLAFTIPLILALAGGCSVLFLFLLLIPICYLHMFGRKRVLTPDGRIIAQPDIYFEPRDRVMPPLPGIPDGLKWVRSVGVQVPGEAECDSTFYAEISGSRKSASSTYGSSYVGYGTYGRQSTYI